MIDKILSKSELEKQDVIELLNIDTHSDDFYKLIARANKLSRSEYKNKGYIFAQIGINTAPCSGNCKFCSLAADNYAVGVHEEKTIEQVAAQAKEIAKRKIAAVFLMTTADFDKNRFIEYAKAVKAILPSNVDLVANVGDFDKEYAKKLKAAGVTGVYHIVRLREGIDTDIKPEVRILTIESALSEGLRLYYCIEPIGKEHSYDEIATEIMRARNYKVDIMAVMKRVGVKGTKFDKSTEISELELTKIAAVTRIAVRPKISMNVHEPMKMPILAGVNQLYAEIGVNPRDTEVHTENSRGYTVDAVEKMLADGEYYL